MASPTSDPLARWKATPSQKATIKYFWVVAALIFAQMSLGIITAHYGVEGEGFYGFPLAEYLPYSVSRTWHVQIGLFWIATAWLAAGLFIGPLVSNHEPKYQRLGVNILFGALLLVVVGSLTGEWLSVKNYMTDTVSFYLGHQGYEYVELGRIWQIALMVGLLLWLVLMLRVLWPALRQKADRSNDRGQFPTPPRHTAGRRDRCDRIVLRSRFDVGAALASDDGRVLALVGRSLVGRRLL